ncbi:MAG: hypothetical protein CME06_01045 [Gemmatimonadetes bacterium]|nr:hypothetical protein [Gemmatimonadota bacterium]
MKVNRERTIREKARKIGLVGTDIDGVWTDARMYYGPDGELMKGFSTYDGMGVARLRAAGIPTAILTSEDTQIVARRAEKLAIGDVHLGVTDKLECMRRIADERGLDLSEIAYIGDDTNDIDLLEAVGLSALAPQSPLVGRLQVDLVVSRRGGEGAFRELAELILDARAEPRR